MVPIFFHSCLESNNKEIIIVTHSLQPSCTIVVQFIQNASAFGVAITSRGTRRASSRICFVAPDQVVVNVIHGLFNVRMELVSPDLAIVASRFSWGTSSETSHVTRTNIVVTRAILAEIGRKKRIKLQLSLLIKQ